jgi:predicted component of type VI protein secretion system
MLPLRVRVEDLDGKGSEAYAFLRSPVRVGRGDLNDLRLDRPYVSSWHGVIQFDDEGIRFIDLGSTNGTYLDGARLERNRPAAILGTSELVVGRLRLVLSRGATEGRARPPEPVTCFARLVAHDVSAAEAAAIAAPQVKEETGPAPGATGPAAADVDFSWPAPPPAAPFVEPAPLPLVEPLAPLAPAASLAPDSTVEAALEGASWQLGVLHDACRQASESFQTAVDGLLGPLSDDQRRAALAAIASRYPFAVVQGAPPPASIAIAPAPAPVPIPVPAAQPIPSVSIISVAASAQFAPSGLGGDALRLVRAFTEAYLSAAAVPTTPAALQQLLGSVAEALETAARGYLELRGGYEQFGREMGIRIPKGEGALARATDARQLVGWLLTPADGESRSRQLAGAFADLMIHQVALLNGVQAGARAMLSELSPEALAAAAERDGKSGLGLKALKEAGQWRMFVERWHGLADEDSAVTDVLFGKAFAKAYSAVAGRRAQTDGDIDPALTPPGRKQR